MHSPSARSEPPAPPCPRNLRPPQRSNSEPPAPVPRSETDRVTSLTIRLVVALTAAILLAAPAAGDSLTDAYALMDRVNESVVELQVDAEPLEDVLDIVSALLDAPVHGDWEALTDLNLERDDLISLRLRRAPGLVVLAGIELELAKIYGRPRFEFDGNRVILTTRKGAAAFVDTEVYDIRSVLADEAALAELRQAPHTGAPAMSDDDDQAEEIAAAPDEADDIEPTRPLTPGERFVDLLMRHVAPDEWIRYGGASAEITERNGMLIVTAAPTLHRRLHQTIDRLRKLTPLTVGLEVTLLTLPADDFRTLESRRDPRPDRFARKLMRAPSAEVTWNSRLRGVFDQAMTIDATAADERLIRLSATPRWDASRSVVNLTLDFERRSAGGDRRTLVTTIALPAAGDVVLLELPGVAPDGATTLLVVDTTGR